MTQSVTSRSSPIRSAADLLRGDYRPAEHGEAILFLDIDGVLLSGRAWLLPVNRRLQGAGAKLTRQEASKLIGREAVFDACAVALVSRICEATGARIVVASSWRYTVGYEQTRAKLLEQGLPEALLHEDWACPVSGSDTPDKAADIKRWLKEHGVTHPTGWLALDDEDIVPGATIRTDALDGLGAREAAAAVRYLGGTDPGLGVRTVPDGDMELVLQAFRGDRIAACRWLEGVDARTSRGQRPSALLARGQRDEAVRQLSALIGADDIS
ncbi:HAD domain-containing protein [Teichococcus aestuarii]|uniref:Uncharacterized protein n=1 Tax=Teichococcus aestuarii TaxID=568898 RepID=A0A2U1UXE1_9PROT|nr:HAD domain-containing protein [Pseudoroseomonas aestuarii]PWC26346.1 hypothetical protein CR165_23735 [Pseudoroseomonas aestuarii]